MTLARWNPLRELETMQQDVNRLFSKLGEQPFGRLVDAPQFNPMSFDGGEVEGRRQWSLATDVIETDNALKLRAALPGVDPNAVHVQVDDGVLTISAERRFEDKQEGDKYCWVEQQYGSFSRSLALPNYADVENIKASYTNGVLELTIPKLELTIPKKESSKPRKIELNIGGNTSAIESEPEKPATDSQPVTSPS